ncbi:hypothetical protein Q5H93_21520 [Hymenobacter sp. ASUV-10]|uniref:Uncharacterized protein n=1 Tax=Hymenobacter aranciens TaxID=3063996 RepID=A0ABT9BGF0_9BACT|nr:hypothetical protein [Hymenobacter sp. ASUV-10]MDO7877339.1 hypothetical protein [Hymenobacter sp. ASUV-10]
MQRLLLSCLLLTVVGCTPPPAERSEAELRQEYAQSRRQLAEREGKEWRRYLQEKLQHRSNLLGQVVVEGSITSTATAAIYTDVVLQVTFQDAEGRVLQQYDTPIKEPIAPGAVRLFKEKYAAPKGTYSTGYVIAEAGFTVAPEQ